MSSLTIRDALVLDAEPIQLLLRYLDYASRFPDFPKNFTPPALVDPTYVPPNRSRGLEILVWVSTGLILLIVGGRMGVRIFVRRIDYGLDDWLMLPSLFFALALSVIILLLIKVGGVGTHVYDLPLSTLDKASKLEFTGVIVYYLSVYFTKLSICAFYSRLFGGQGSKEKHILFATVVIYTAILFTSIAIYIFACRPIPAIWRVSTRLDEFRCIDLTAMLLTYGIILTIADIWLLVLPIRKLIRLQLPPAIKIALTFIFALGGIAVGGAVLKLLYVSSVYNTFDPTWNSIPFMFGAQVESAAAIITASLPALNFIWVRMLPRKFRTKMFSSYPAPLQEKQIKTKTSRDMLQTHSPPWYSSNTGNDTYAPHSLPASSKIMTPPVRPFEEILVRDMPVFYDTHTYERYIQDYPNVRHHGNPNFMQEPPPQASFHSREAPARPDSVAWPLSA